MVEIERNRGIRIRGVTVEDTREVFELRLMMEVPAASYAAAHGGSELAVTLRRELHVMLEAALAGEEAGFMRHDRAMHEAISGAIGNRRLSDGIATLRDAIQARGASTVHRSHGLTEIEDEHVPIIEAIESADAGGAAAAAHMDAHLINTGTLLMSQVAAASGGAVRRDWADRLRRHLRNMVEPGAGA